MKIHKEYSIDIDGKIMTARFTDLADQAHGSVLLEMEGTIVMATAVISKDGKHNPGFFNLTVEYLERYYAAGKIGGAQYIRREGRPTTQAVLGARVIDRTIRPLFQKHIKNAVQVIVTVLSLGEGDPIVIGINASSLALATSHIPWGGPVSSVHMSKTINNEGIHSDLRLCHYIRDTKKSRETYTCDSIVCGNEFGINMIEALAYEMSEDIFTEGLSLSHKTICKLQMWQKNIIKETGKEKIIFEKRELPEEYIQRFTKELLPKIQTDIFGPNGKKNIEILEDEWLEQHVTPLLEDMHYQEKIAEEDFDELRVLARDYFNNVVDIVLHEQALTNQKRADLRKLDEVRNLYAQAGGLSDRIHGSGIFYRGETHAMSFLTLGGPDDVLTVEGMEINGEQRFFHHYNFPPYSSGGTGRVGGMNRREIGLLPIMPTVDEFPYTIRVVSESTASNGSTSQASICASTLALMDGGVPIKAPVAGIALGVMIDNKDSKRYAILTDIQGPEDHHGDMDFKVAGTRNGITAIQLDIKVDAIPLEILAHALLEGKKARLTILDTIEKEIPKPRAELAQSAPRILTLTISTDLIGRVIGKGGETIQGIQKETGAIVTINDDGRIYITGEVAGANKALDMIAGITKEWKVGEITEGVVVKVLEIGVIVKLSSFADGLVHISQLAPFRVERVASLVQEGMRVPVKITEIDKEKNRISLSIKEADPDFFPKPDHVKPAI